MKTYFLPLTIFFCLLFSTWYCKSRDFTVSKTIATKISSVKNYEDCPDVRELFRAAKNNQFDKVVVTEISRIVRNAREIRDTVSYLHDRRISIVFKNLGGLKSLDERGNENFVKVNGSQWVYFG